MFSIFFTQSFFAKLRNRFVFVRFVHVRQRTRYKVYPIPYRLFSFFLKILKKKFLAEGRVLARLRDPHLIRVFDLAIDEATGVPYFVMDIITYSDGVPHTLDDVELGDLEEDYVFD